MSSKSGFSAWSARKKVIVCLVIALGIIAIAVGLGVGLGVGLHHNGSGGNQGSGAGTGNTTVKWQPAVGTNWQIELLYALNDTSIDVPIYDIDLYDNPQSTIANLQKMGRRVICYFSAGTYENWRPDAGEFKESDLGNKLGNWPGEKWLNTNSNNVRNIMQTRLDLAVTKGCDGVDPDNVDAYDNSNGLGLTQGDAIDYVNWLASEAHTRGLSIGLKNGGAIIDSVIGNMQWSVNEQCAQYAECGTYAAFTAANKPVFHIEYPKGENTNNLERVTTQQRADACNAAGSAGFSTVIKNMDLGNWVEYCS